MNGVSNNQFVGDRSQGCACAYTFMEQAAARRTRRAGNEHNGIHNVDSFTTPTGETRTRFFCHRGLTGASPRPMDSPPPYAPRGFVRNVANETKKAFWSFFRFMCPRINFGIGINLWRFRG